MRRDLTHMLNQTNDMQEKKRVYDLSFILFWLEILVSEKFLFSLKVDPCCSSNVRTPPPHSPRQTFVSFHPQKPPAPKRGRKPDLFRRTSSCIRFLLLPVFQTSLLLLMHIHTRVNLCLRGRKAKCAQMHTRNITERNDTAVCQCSHISY